MRLPRMRLTRGNRGFGGDPLLMAGVVMMAVALVLTVVAVVVIAVFRDEPGQAVAAETAAKSSVELPLRSDPPGEARVEETLPEPEPEPERRPLPAGESDWQKPTEKEIKAANEPRHYELPSGAIMALTIRAMGIYNAPVFDSDSQWALTNGVAHVPETSLPWSATHQRNVYLAGHRIGYRGTGSRMVFYNLNKLGKGDEVVLKDRNGKVYRYRVSEVFVARPTDSWVMGRVRGRDMVTLQSCTPIPTFEQRLIVRADRV